MEAVPVIRPLPTGAVALGAVAVLLALTGCGGGSDGGTAAAPTPPDGFATAEVEGVRFAYPRGWKKDGRTEQNQKLVEVTGDPTPAGLPPNAAVGVGKAEADQQTSVRFHKDAARLRQGPSYTVTGERDVKLDGAVWAHEVDSEYDQPAQGGTAAGPDVRVRVRDLLVRTQDGRQLDFFVRAPKTDFDGTELDRVFDTLRLR